MTTEPVYLCFTTWVQMRHFLHVRRLRDSDVYLAHGDHERWLKVAERRIVFVRSDHQTEGRDLTRWTDNADVARRRNTENNHTTEIIYV